MKDEQMLLLQLSLTLVVALGLQSFYSESHFITEANIIANFPIGLKALFSILFHFVLLSFFPIGIRRFFSLLSHSYRARFIFSNVILVLLIFISLGTRYESLAGFN